MTAPSRRVAVFQAFHSLQIHTSNVVESLISAGYQVDVFLFHCESSVELPSFPGAMVYDFTSLKTKWSNETGWLRKTVSAVSFFVIEPLSGSAERMFSKGTMSKTRDILELQKYAFFVGIEKMGLVWAGMMAKQQSTPFFYYSLELYLDDYVKKTKLGKRIRFTRVRALEREYHQQAAGTIVQDEVRQKELFESNAVSSQPAVHLPVSIRGGIIHQRSSFLRDKFHIPQDVKIVLQFGLISKDRLSDVIVRAAQKFSHRFILVMHGPVIDKDLVHEIRSLDTAKNVILSTDLLSPSDITEMMCSADIGLCFYDNKTKNEFHAGFSSEKLARYFQAGVPVVAFNYPTFQHSVAVTNSGECIGSLDELCEAVNRIDRTYEQYREHSFLAFERYFQFDKQFPRVLAFMESKM